MGAIDLNRLFHYTITFAAAVRVNDPSLRSREGHGAMAELGELLSPLPLAAIEFTASRTS